MNAPRLLFISTRDDDLSRRLSALLTPLGDVRTHADIEVLEGELSDAVPSVIIIDLRSPEILDSVQRLHREHREHLVIVLGEPRSEPLLEAETFGIFGCEALDCERRRLQGLVERAFDLIRERHDNHTLREEVRQLSIRAAEPFRGSLASRTASGSRSLTPALRRIENLESLFEAIVEYVAATAMVTRVGLYARTRDEVIYRLRSGLRCMVDNSSLAYGARDNLVRWMAKQAHLVARITLDHVTANGDRAMLRRAMDDMGAEVLVPLLARGQVIGWLALGRRATGLPFDMADLEDLSLLGEQIATTLENALLYEEAAVQKTLAEKLLHAMPMGIVAVGTNSVIRWFNHSAQRIMNMDAQDVLQHPVNVLGTRMADLIGRTLRAEPQEEPQEWTDPLTKRQLAVTVQRLMNGPNCVGAVALIKDLTVERALEERKEQLERTAFWTELAASMSHEIRNPLVAIKTFAQLLPERYNDDEFRSEFSKMVAMEVDRLNAIIEQINQFAHPPELVFREFDVRDALSRGLNLAQLRHGRNGIKIDLKVPEYLPRVFGDEYAMAECFAHVITNSIEASSGREHARIEVSAQRMVENQKDDVRVTVRDNAGGIPNEIRDKVFSPFCTTKARGMGLGLPIVKRTVFDHNGRVDIDTGDRGTSVTIVLPGTGREEKHEAPVSNRR